MHSVKKAFWRFEFKTDLTRASAKAIPVAYVLEANWPARARWLGMTFRKKLTKIELDLINAETWPELTTLEPFMSSVFATTWSTVTSAAKCSLGSEEVARRYSGLSALQLVPVEPPLVAVAKNFDEAFQGLYKALLTFDQKLVPIAVADVVPLTRKAPAARISPTPVGQISQSELQLPQRAA